MGEPLPLVKGLSASYETPSGTVNATTGVTLNVKRGESVCLVGESGSGKSTVARCVLRLINPTSGKISFEGSDVTSLRGKSLKWYRRSVQAVFQNPFLSLNPRMKVESIVAEPPRVHLRMSVKEVREEDLKLLEKVGLPREIGKRHPHELSGGQAQRVAIAMAPRPKSLVLDKLASALDVSVQAQILNLLADLRNELKLSYMLISHDLSVVKYINDFVAVMYLVLEYAPSEELFSDPRHPYTRALLSSVPEPDVRRSRSRIVLPGEPPSPVNPPAGCRLSSRCPYAMDLCKDKEPELVNIGSDHAVRCWLTE